MNSIDPISGQAPSGSAQGDTRALIGYGVLLTWLWWRHPEVLEPLDDARES